MADAPLDYDTYRRTFEQVPDGQLPGVLQRFRDAVTSYKPFDGGMSMTPNWLVRKKIAGGFGKLLGAPAAQQRTMFTNTLNENDGTFRNIFSKNLPLFQSFYSTLPKPAPVVTPPPAPVPMVKPGSFADSLDTDLLTNYMKSAETRGKIAALAEPAVPTTGPAAIAYALKNLDVDRLEQEAQKVVKSKKVSKRSNAISILNAVQGLRRNGHTPSDLMISRVPVIPPQFRPFTVIGDSFTPGDANELYRDLFKVRNAYNESRKELGDAGSNDARLHLYDSVKSLYGYADPVEPKTAARGVSGFLKKVTGMSPKTSWLQRKMLSKTQDNVGRGVIIVDPELGLDEVGVPKEMAWKIFAPYIQSHMVQKGMAPSDSVRSIRDRTPEAARALDTVVKNRPVMYSRAPAWHKFSTIGGYAKLIDGDAISINALVGTGSNSDHDGDDQIAYVYMLLETKKLKNNNQLKDWTLLNEGRRVDAMKAPNHVPVYDTTKHQLFLVDLEDFPRAEFQCTSEGTNGPIEFFHAPEGVQVVAFDEVNSRPVWAPVKFFSRHPGRLVEIVNLSDGQQIITDDDPRAVYGIPFDSEALTLERDTPTNAERRNFAVPCCMAPETETDINEITAPGLPDDKLPLDWDVGYWLGAMCGDGWWNKKSYDNLQSSALQWQHHIADLKGFNASRIERITGKLRLGIFWTSRAFNKADHPDRYGDTVKYTASSARYGQPLCEFFSKHLGGDKGENHTGSGSKRLPGFFLRAPKSFREGLLCGLIDTDGTICVSNGKDKPQLQIAFSSTSLRLVREARLLCRSLGIRSTLMFSKLTTKGNVSWLLSISTVDATLNGCMANLSTPEKRDNFNSVVVDKEAKSAVSGDKIPFPMRLVARLSGALGCSRQPDIFDTKETHAARACMSTIAANARRKKDGITRASAVALVAALKHRSEAKEARRLECLAWLKTVPVDKVHFHPDISSMLSLVVQACAPIWGAAATYKAGQDIRVGITAAARRGFITHRIAARIEAWLESARVTTGMEGDLFKKWERLIDAPARWSFIKSVEKTGKAEDGYDLTVPGYETFMNEEGVILSNTQQIHVPSSDEAVADVRDRIMPSKMLFSDRNYDMIPASPKHEHILGLFSAQQRSSKNSYKFPNESEAMAAIQNGTVKLSDEVEIGNKRQSPLKF